MSKDLKVLANNRENILLAELAAWLHNIGKLDPNFLFLVMQTGEPPEVLEIYRIPGQYSFKRFCKPTVLMSRFLWENLKGPLYFVDIGLRNEIEDLKKKIDLIKKDLDMAKSEKHKEKEFIKKLGEKLNKLKNLKQEREQEMKEREKILWEYYEREIESCYLKIIEKWPLGSLLTLMWEDWFDKPNISSYEPGSSSDPDYQRTPKSDLKLKNNLSMDLPLLLLLSHGEVSGQEKRGLNSDGRYVEVASYQVKPDPKLGTLRKSTVFGYEAELNWKKWVIHRKFIIDFMLKYWDVPINLYKSINRLFLPLCNALGDTQRPINEISLWDYSSSVAALFKSAVARAILSGEIPKPSNMYWRLLSVRFNAMKFIFQAQSVADLIARKRLVNEIYDIIKHLFEVEIPLGSVVYKDENGVVFVIPDIPQYERTKLEQLVKNKIHWVIKNPRSMETWDKDTKIYGAEDIQVHVQIGEPNRGKKLNLMEVLVPCAKNPPVFENFNRWWKVKREICVVCGLRPEGYIEEDLPNFVTEKKARERHLCGICLARRGRRSQEWANRNRNATIWIDEVADTNGRVALIVGYLDLKHWLSGKMIKSLAIGIDKNNRWLSKPPTFARISRVWNITKTFWSEILKDVKSSMVDDRRRIRLFLNANPGLGDYHAYELKLGKAVIRVVWIPPSESEDGYLLTIENLGYIAKQLGASKDIYEDSALSAIFVEDQIRKRLPWITVLVNPETKFSPNNKEQRIQIISTDYEEVAYSTTIPILTEPQVFMALVPADRAMEIVEKIKTKYEREMGKVRNRLPLHLGVVFAHRMMPLRAILDAGKRMLEQKSHPLMWKVMSVERKYIDKGDNLPKRFDADKNGQFKEWYEITLKNGKHLTWYVPALMGDGQTEDDWYPYVFLASSDEPTGRGRYYATENPWDPTHNHKWVVHAGELKSCDEVYFTPATFDFIFLEANVKRHDVAYDSDGRRITDRRKPYLLDEVEELKRAWNLLSGNLTSSQIHQMIDLIETARGDWFGYGEGDVWERSRDDDTFKEFCRSVIANAEWKNKPKDRDIENLTNWAASGLLTDTFTLHHRMVKEEVKRDKEQKTT